MAAFYAGPPPSVPGDERECRFGRWRWFGRALRDAWRLPADRAGAAFVVAVVAALATSVTGVVIAKAHYGIPLDVLLFAADLAIGYVIAFGIAFVWALTAWGKRDQWHVAFDKAQEGGLLVSCKSGHWHMVHEPRVDITGPEGSHWTAVAPDTSRHFAVRPGDPLGPIDLGAVVGRGPAPGDYLFKWMIDVDNRARPLVVATAKREVS